MKLNSKAFAITTGLCLGFGLFLFTWWVIVFDGITNNPTLIGAAYRGYTISPLGSFIGLGYGLIDGFVFGYIFSWVYNRLAN
ncbi:MAG: hypothetical protein GY729_07930 [Desulfobacteraceae bacterium]|nr:hypothetical protein [Desulfobacteraceae bacterium]